MASSVLLPSIATDKFTTHVITSSLPCAHQFQPIFLQSHLLQESLFNHQCFVATTMGVRGPLPIPTFFRNLLARLQPPKLSGAIAAFLHEAIWVPWRLPQRRQSRLKLHPAIRIGNQILARKPVVEKSVVIERWRSLLRQLWRRCRFRWRSCRWLC